MNFLFKILTVVMVAGLAACVQQSVPETSVYRGEKLVMQANATPGVLDAKFELMINGETVISDRTQPFGGTSQSFEGSFRGQQVIARATAVQKFASAYTLVDVFINGEHIDTLVV